MLSGDSHASWTNDLFDDAGTLAAVELGCTAITSPSYGSILPGLGPILADANKEVVFCDQDSKGYALLTLTPREAVAEHVAVSTILTKPYTRRVTARHVTLAGKEPWRAGWSTRSPGPVRDCCKRPHRRPGASVTPDLLRVHPIRRPNGLKACGSVDAGTSPA
ncbi:alkaline phosphatase D family protein [Sphingomonas sp. MMS24-JH45]